MRQIQADVEEEWIAGLARLAQETPRLLDTLPVALMGLAAFGHDQRPWHAKLREPDVGGCGPLNHAIEHGVPAAF